LIAKKNIQIPTLRARIDLLLKLDRDEDAAADLELMTYLEPENPKNWTDFGELLLSIGRYEDAITRLNRARLQGAPVGETYLSMGRAFEKLRKYQEAVECYDQVLADSLNFSDAWLRKGVCLRALELYADAVPNLEEANRRFDEETDTRHGASSSCKIAEGWGELSRCQEQLGLVEKSLGSVQKAIEACDGSTQRYWTFCKGLFCTNAGLFPEALTCFKDLLIHEPETYGKMITKDVIDIEPLRKRPEFQSMLKSLIDTTIPSMSPLKAARELVEHLDTEVWGQDRAKRAVSRAAYSHFYTLDIPCPWPHLRIPEHSLIIGGSGTGKTLLVKSLAKALDIPFLYCNAASLSAEGLVGDSFGDVLAQFCANLDETSAPLGRAILFLDEIDKLAQADDSGRGASKRVVQQELLAFLDGNQIGRAKSSGSGSVQVDSTNFLCIGAGAFVGLETIVSRRTGRSRLGFNTAQKLSRISQNDIIQHVAADDIVEFGIIPELIARFTNITSTHSFDEDEFLAILESERHSPLSAKHHFFKAHGVAIEFESAAKRVLATTAVAEDGGVRRLRRLVSLVLEDYEWDLPDLVARGTERILITGEYAKRQLSSE
jgi:ATP-dependent Clp protease ATP-binding subunit ClpX